MSSLINFRVTAGAEWLQNDEPERQMLCRNRLRTMTSHLHRRFVMVSSLPASHYHLLSTPWQASLPGIVQAANSSNPIRMQAESSGIPAGDSNVAEVLASQQGARRRQREAAAGIWQETPLSTALSILHGSKHISARLPVIEHVSSCLSCSRNWCQPSLSPIQGAYL